MNARDRRSSLMRESAGFRHGVVMPPTSVETGPADIPGIAHVGVPQSPATGWASPSGGAAWDPETAELSAIGEALERYAASVCPLPVRRREQLANEQVIEIEEFALFSQSQRAEPGFPFASLYRDDRDFTNVFSLRDNRAVWVPVDLVPLRSDVFPSVTTSSGLACGRSQTSALLRALQEVIERDALMTTWLHGIPGRSRPLAARYLDPVHERGGSVFCADVTPDYSPFPVAVVAGNLPRRGRPRISLGAACRASWGEAVDKAYLEWAQGIVFAGYHTDERPGLRFERHTDVRTFEDHAAYYTVHPEHWDAVTLPHGEPATVEPRELSGTTQEILSEAVSRLSERGVRLFYRDLTTIDLTQLGLTCVRVLSPELTPIHCDQRYPFLGGRTADVRWRYPWAEALPSAFPNPLPHPLG